MKILVTAGSTRCMIDQVRCLTNIFGGRTGLCIAEGFQARGHSVTLLTSAHIPGESDLSVIRYKTYDDLYYLMGQLISTQEWDVIVHSAAVSDYKVEKTLYRVPEIGNPSLGSRKNPTRRFRSDYETKPHLEELDSSTKVGSNHAELFLKLVPTEKIVDHIRPSWGFKGKLVKFKLQVGIGDLELIEIAKKSRAHSQADLIIANCLEWSQDFAYIVDAESATKVPRNELPERLILALGNLE